MEFELRKTRDFGDLVTDTFTFVKICWRPLLRSFIYICGFFVLAACVTDIAYKLKLSDVAGVIPRRNRIGRIFGTEYFLLLFLSYFQFIVISLNTLCFVSLYNEKGKMAPSVEEVWAYFKYYFFRYTITFILAILIQMVGLVFLLIPGIYLAPVTSLMLAAMVLENGSMRYSLKRAFFLISGHWWTTFGALFIVTVVVYIVMGFSAVPSLIFTMLRSFSPSIKQLVLGGNIVFIIIQHAFSAVLMLPWIVMALSYFSLTELKEGVGLSSRLSALGAKHPKADLPEEEY